MSLLSPSGKIAIEKKAKTGELYLGFKGLKEIPKELLELDHLHSLDLRNNEIMDCSLLERLPNLISLNLEENQISDIHL